MSTLEKYNEKAVNYVNEMSEFLFNIWNIKGSNYSIPTIEVVKPIRVYDKRQKKFRYSTPAQSAPAYYCPIENKIVLIRPRRKNVNYTTREYNEYCDNIIIGSLMADSETIFIADISHEMAHWFQEKVVKLDGIFEKDHGKGFQLIYALLREKFVNNRSGVKRIGLFKKSTY